MQVNMPFREPKMCGICQIPISKLSAVVRWRFSLQLRQWLAGRTGGFSYTVRPPSLTSDANSVIFLYKTPEIQQKPQKRRTENRKGASLVTYRRLSRGQNNHLDGSLYTLVWHERLVLLFLQNIQNTLCDAESSQLSKDLLYPFKLQGAKYEVCCKTSKAQRTKIWSLKLNLPFEGNHLDALPSNAEGSKMLPLQHEIYCV